MGVILNIILFSYEIYVLDSYVLTIFSFIFKFYALNVNVLDFISE